MEAFPIPERRRFINWFLGTSFGALAVSVLYPIARFLSPPKIAEPGTAQVEAGLTDDVAFREKGFKIIRFGADPVIVVRADENDFRAFSATCTHLDCIVGYQKDRSRLWCNCHGGAYDLTGRNVAGPPPRPLTAFQVNLVKKSEGTSTIVVSKA
ncbi:MAG: ubiquinol-cytochrome c reductase iron-sulfur subunit [Thermoanaerobaculia bacterium]